MMNCPNCGTKVSLKGYLSTDPQGFVCLGCRLRLIADQSNTMLRYVAYLAVLLFLKYSMELSLIGILLYFAMAACFDFIFAAKTKVVDEVGDKDKKETE